MEHQAVYAKPARVACQRRRDGFTRECLVYTLHAVTFLDAAREILQTASRPLSAAEITEIALSRGLITTSGKTPESTMSARLYGAEADGSFQREYEPGRERARRGSVRWSYVGDAKPRTRLGDRARRAS